MKTLLPRSFPLQGDDDIMSKEANAPRIRSGLGEGRADLEETVPLFLT